MSEEIYKILEPMVVGTITKGPWVSMDIHKEIKKVAVEMTEEPSMGKEVTEVLEEIMEDTAMAKQTWADSADAITLSTELKIASGD